MTVSSATSKLGYDGDGITAIFATPYFIANSHIVAIHSDAGGVETTWVENTHYTLVGAGNEAGGALTVITTPTDYTPAAGERLVIKRLVPNTQGSDYPAGGGFPSATVEQDFDLAAMRAQQNAEAQSRTMLFKDTVDLSSFDSALPAPEAVKPILAVKADGSGFEFLDDSPGSAAAAAASAAAALVSETNAAATLAGALQASNNLSDVADVPTALGSLGITAYIGKNKIINGNFDVWQRGTSFTASGYGPDRWFMALGSGAAATYSRQAFTLGQTGVPGEPQYFARLDRATAGTVGTTIQQRVEGVRTLAGQTATLSFYAKASAAVTLDYWLRQHFGTGGTPSADVDTTWQNAALTTAWQKFTYTVTLGSITGKTLGSNGDDFLNLIFSLPIEAGIVSVDIAQVQLEAGSVVTDFEQRPITQELALCDRYYQRNDSSHRAYIYSDGSTARSLSIDFRTAMRAPPAFTFTGAVNWATGPNAVTIQPSGALIDGTGALATTVAYFAGWTADAEL